jgi:hypothetical protein
MHRSRSIKTKLVLERATEAAVWWCSCSTYAIHDFNQKLLVELKGVGLLMQQLIDAIEELQEYW